MVDTVFLTLTETWTADILGQMLSFRIYELFVRLNLQMTHTSLQGGGTTSRNFNHRAR